MAIKSVNDGRPHDSAGYEINDIIEEALAAPPRNCDKYGADGAAVACRKASGINWSHIILVRKVIGWLFSTEGGAE